MRSWSEQWALLKEAAGVSTVNQQASTQVGRSYTIEVNPKKDKQPRKVVVEVVKRRKKPVNS